MKNKYLKILFPIALILALTLSMIGARSVLADDAPPPPTEEISTEMPPTEEPSPTEEPPSTEEPSTGETATLPEETVPEIMEQLPEETTLVVLDENGELLPLVSNEAADILVTGDPQWCPAGVTPGTDTLGQCTVAHASFTDLINDLETNTTSYFGAGTIYVAHDYDATTAGDAGNDIIFDYGNVSLTDMVVQGGWDFAQDKVVGTSTIDLGSGNSLEFWDWGASTLTLKDLILTNSDDLFIGGVTTADVTFENVEVTDTEHGAYIETEGNVEINNSQFNYTDSDNGATIYTVGNVVISNSTFNDNNYSGVEIYSYGNVTLTDVWAEGNDDGDGAHIEADGDVTITDSTFKDNYYDGAYIDTCGCSTGNVFVQSSAFVENGDRGLVVYAFGNITVKDIQAELNEVGGVELDNCIDFFGGGCLNSGPATITMSGTNIIKDNGGNPILFMGSGPLASVGLWVMSIGDASINGVNVTGNGAGDIGGGAFFFSDSGELSISNSTFSDNCTTFECDFLGFGMLTLTSSGSNVTLNGVTANGNGNGDGSTYTSDLGIGAIVMTGGNAFVKKSTFSNNCNAASCSGGGIWVMSDGDTYFNFVTADNNGPFTSGGGSMIMANGNADVYCSQFTNHAAGVGLMVDVPGGSTANLYGVTFSGNLTDVVPPTSGGTLVENPFDCNPLSGTGSGKAKTNLPALPLNIVNVNNGNTVVLDCEQYSGTKLILENGNSLVIPCPMEGSASLSDHSQDDLPGSLPDGTVFQSAFTSAFGDEVTTNGKLDKYVLISFVIPEGVDPSSLSILFWDGTQWVEVKGTFVRNEDGVSYFEAYVDYAGTFVLAQK